MKKYFIFILIVVVYQACNTSKEGNITNIENLEINVKDTISQIDITPFVKKVVHIKLETRDACLLQDVKKIVVTPSELLIFDGFVYVFDLDGNFKYKVGELGKGPGEILQGFDFVVDNKTGNIEIYDFKQHKLVLFAKDGTFLTEKKKLTIHDITRFEKFENGNYVVMQSLSNIPINNQGLLGYKICVGNFEDGFTQYRPLYKHQYDSNATLNQSFTKSGSHFYYLEVLNDTIFEINNQKGFSSSFYVDFGKNKMPKNIVKLPTIDRMIALRDSKHVATVVDNFYCWKDYIYFNYLYNEHRWNVLRINGRLYISKYISFKDIKYPRFDYFDGEKVLASIVYPDRMDMSLKKVFNTTPSIYDNPIITLFYLY